MKCLAGWVFLILLVVASSAQAGTVTLNVDSAPNVYGSSAWMPWWTQAKADVVAGTFINMRTGTYPGTTDIDPLDEIVYSTGDLGKRLHWIYWAEGESVSSLDGRLEVKWVIDWGGDEWTYDSGGWAANTANVGWSQPASWEDYSDGGVSGVIGSVGFAWWATDDDAPPYDSGGSPYDEADLADIMALRDAVFAAQTFATGYVRIRADANSGWETSSIRLNLRAVPVPQAAWLGMALMVGLAGVRRLRRRI